MIPTPTPTHDEKASQIITKAVVTASGSQAENSRNKALASTSGTCAVSRDSSGSKQKYNGPLISHMLAMANPCKQLCYVIMLRVGSFDISSLPIHRLHNQSRTILIELVKFVKWQSLKGVKSWAAPNGCYHRRLCKSPWRWCRCGFLDDGALPLGGNKDEGEFIGSPCFGTFFRRCAPELSASSAEKCSVIWRCKPSQAMQLQMRASTRRSTRQQRCNHSVMTSSDAYITDVQ